MKSLVEALSRTVQGEHRIANSIMYGTVSAVSDDGRRVRVVVGEDEDGAVSGPWIPIGQWDGVMKMRLRPKVGQQVVMLAPSGDWEQAKALPFTWSDGSPPPSEDPSEDVFEQGAMRIAFKSDSIEMKVGDTILLISNDGVKIRKGGTELDLTGGLIRLKSPLIETDGETKLDKGEVKVVTEGGPALRVYAKA